MNLAEYLTISVHYQFTGHDYQLKLLKGEVLKPAGTTVFRLSPNLNTIDLNMADNN